MKDIITNIVLVILAVFFVIMGAVFLTEMHDNDRVYIRKTDSFLYDVQYGRYCSMVEAVYQNRVNGAKETAEMKEMYGIADYFEAASLYHAYEQSGEQDKAATFKEKMEKAQNMMGDFSYVKEDIDQKLLIQ